MEALGYKSCLADPDLWYKAQTTYASVVSRETVRMALMLAALNDLDVQCGDVMKETGKGQ